MIAQKMSMSSEQKQSLTLTQSTRQFLSILQMPTFELEKHLQDAVLSNPLFEPFQIPERALYETRKNRDEIIYKGYVKGNEESDRDFTDYFIQQKLPTEYLSEQLGQMRLLDEPTRRNCEFLIGCLDQHGYLDCPLKELAEEQGKTVFEMEQALFVIQSLDPAGVGARNLSECLLLQLVQSENFTHTNITLIQKGLPLLAKKDIRGVAELLHVSYRQAQEAAEFIRTLNPLPFAGLRGAEGEIGYITPEAIVDDEDGLLSVTMNDDILTALRLDPTYTVMIGDDTYREIQNYLKEKQTEANSLLRNVKSRKNMIYRIICMIVAIQHDYFLVGAPLKAMQMKDFAEELGISTSTVSRAIKDKYIQHKGKLILLRDLFTSPAFESGEGEISSSLVKRHIKLFIEAEDKQHPLSDSTLVQALATIGIPISRRTAAKYRAEMGIPGQAGRRKQKH